MDDKKKRLLIIVLFGLAAIGAVLLFSQPAVPPPGSVTTNPGLPAGIAEPKKEPAIQSIGKAKLDSGKPILPLGANVAGQVIRDIFAPPAEYARLIPQEPRPGSLGGGPAISGGPAPVLTGIIMGNGNRVAILRQGAISRSYRVGETAGAYRISSISADSVSLVGPTGTIVLKMGQ